MRPTNLFEKLLPPAAKEIEECSSLLANGGVSNLVVSNSPGGWDIIGSGNKEFAVDGEGGSNLAMNLGSIGDNPEDIVNDFC